MRFLSSDIGGEHIIVPLGASVHTLVTLSATQPMTGGLTIEVRKAMAVSPDETKKMCFFSVALLPDPQEVGPCVFSADELTISPFRQYFVRLYWDDTLIYSPVDPETREHVMTRQVGTPTATP